MAAFLRFHDLSTNPPALNQDEVVNGYDAYSIGHTLRDHHGEFLPRTLLSFDDTASVALTYLTIPFVLLIGLTNEAVRMPIALAGVACVFLVYLLVYEISKNKRLALLNAFVLAVSPWAITLSRVAVPPGIMPFFMLLLLWFFARGIYRQKYTSWYLVGAGIAATGLSYSYPASEVTTPVFVVGICIIYLYKQWRKLATFLLSYAVCAIPLYYNFPKTSFQRYGAVKIPYHGMMLLKAIAVRYKGYFGYNFYFGLNGTNVMMHVPGVGNLFSFLAIILILGGLLLLCKTYCATQNSKEWRKLLHRMDARLVIVIVFLLLLTPIPAAVSIDFDYVDRALLMLPLVGIIISLTVYFLIGEFSKLLSLQVGLSILFIIGCLIALWNFESVYNNQYPAIAAQAQFQYGLPEGVKYVVTRQNHYHKIIIDSSANQPYIYYLFYSSYNPRKLDYREINIANIESEPYHVPQIGKYYFTSVTPAMLTGAKYLTSFSAYGHTWYTVYSQGSELILQKNYTPDNIYWD
jgi:4-amino-4-deoxy-L-arabinose transferase-like glycosyltransferase